MDWLGYVLGAGCIAVGAVFKRIAGAGARRELRRSPSIGFRTAKSLAPDENWLQMHVRMAPVMTRLAWLLWLAGALTLLLAHVTAWMPAVAFATLTGGALIMQRNLNRVDAGLPGR